MAGSRGLNLPSTASWAFAAFGSDLDKASKAQRLERGSRLVELLKQPAECNRSRWSVRSSCRVWAGTSDSLDDVPLEDIKRFETEFLENVEREARRGHPRSGRDRRQPVLTP